MTAPAKGHLVLTLASKTQPARYPMAALDAQHLTKDFDKGRDVTFSDIDAGLIFGHTRGDILAVNWEQDE